MRLCEAQTLLCPLSPSSNGWYQTWQGPPLCQTLRCFVDFICCAHVHTGSSGPANPGSLGAFTPVTFLYQRMAGWGISPSVPEGATGPDLRPLTESLSCIPSFPPEDWLRNKAPYRH